MSKQEATRLADALQRDYENTEIQPVIDLLRQWPDGEPVAWLKEWTRGGTEDDPSEPYTARRVDLHDRLESWMPATTAVSPLYTSPPDSAARIPERLWLWRNWVDGKPEYWAFDNPFPLFMDSDDPQTLGEPCGYAIVKPSRRGRPDVSDEDAAKRIKSDAARIAELEAQRDALLDERKLQQEVLVETRAALKVAGEALEDVLQEAKWSTDSEWQKDRAAKALHQIKEAT